MKGKRIIKKLLVIVIIIAILGAILNAVFGKKEEVAAEDTRPTVLTERPGKGDITVYTELIGTIEPVSTVSVMPKMSGELLEVMFQAGDYVEQGQPLCRIDSDALTSLKIQVDSAQVAMNDANTSLARTQALFAAGSVSQETLEQAQSNATSRRLSYQSAKNQYDLQVKYTVVTAPISGVIESRDVEPHDMVSPSTAVCVISAKDQIQVKFGVSEKVMKNMTIGAKLTVEKNGTEYHGSITEIGSMVSSDTGLYDIKATLTDAQSLTTGSKVKLSVVMEAAKNVMTIPVDSVLYDNGTPFVYIFADGIAKKTVIESGVYDTSTMEVSSGLKGDEDIIVTWSNELADGAKVKLKTEIQTPESGDSAEDDGTAETSEAETTASEN